MLRRAKKPPDPTDPILIVDSGADQILGGPIWRVLRATGRYVITTGPLAGRHTGTTLPIVSAAAKLIDASGKEWCAIAHEMLHVNDPNQHESLLPTAQVRDAGNAVDECPSDALTTRGDFGTQCCIFNGNKLPLQFNGLSSFYQLEAITDIKLDSLPRIVLTKDEPYEPTVRTKTRRQPVDEIDWKRTLAFPPDNVLKATLEATTQLVPTVEAESREIMSVGT